MREQRVDGSGGGGRVRGVGRLQLVTALEWDAEVDCWHEVVWVHGMKTSETCCVTSHTKHLCRHLQGGNQQLARGLASKAGAGVLTGAPVAQITKETDGKFTVLVAPSTPPSSAGGSSCSEEPTADAGHAAVVVLPGEEVEQSAGELEPLTAPQRRLQQQQQQQDVEGWGAELAQQAEQGGGGGSGAAEAGALHAQQHGPFDAVILAAPLEGSGISLAGLDPPPRMPARKYRQTVTTLVEGTVRASYFGLTAMPFRECGL